jgi:hypothetical protein
MDGTEPHLYAAGDYGQWGGVWYARTPNHLLGHLGSHDITVHTDGTITASPSIFVRGRSDDQQWHGYLERGVWRSA